MRQMVRKNLLRQYPTQSPSKHGMGEKRQRNQPERVPCRLPHPKHLEVPVLGLLDFPSTQSPQPTALVSITLFPLTLFPANV